MMVFREQKKVEEPGEIPMARINIKFLLILKLFFFFRALKENKSSPREDCTGLFDGVFFQHSAGLITPLRRE